MRTYATEDLRIRLQFILNLDVYPPKWPVVRENSLLGLPYRGFPRGPFTHKPERGSSGKMLGSFPNISP